MLQEELRSRLILIKMALLKTQSDFEFMRIQNAFTNKTIKVFLTMVTMSSALEPEQLTKILIDRLQEGKSSETCDTILKYSDHFFAEFSHFLRIHGFMKSKNPVAQSEQRLIQQNNFFSIHSTPTIQASMAATAGSQPWN